MSDTGAADAMPASPSGTLREAPPPFNKANADVVLRTPDMMDFRVFRCILEEVSPVFRDMFKLPPPDPHSQNVGTQSTLEGDPAGETAAFSIDIPIIAVSEHSTVLEPLLRSFWPPANYVPASLDAFKPVIAAAHKYQMHGLLAIFEERLHAFAPLGPLRVYAIAVIYDMPDAMGHAARSFLSLSAARADECVDELQHITGKDYYRLLAYRRRCVAALKEMLDDLTWLKGGSRGWVFLHCKSCKKRAGRSYNLPDYEAPCYITVWMGEYYDRIIALLLDTPCFQTIQRPSLLDQVLQEAAQCNTCNQHIAKHIRIFMETLSVQVKNTLAKISLDG